MKALKIILLLVMIGTLASAATDITIDTQIQNIQNAPASERVELMNAFKIQLSNMNTEDRSAAIEQIQTKMQNNSEPGEMNHEQMPIITVQDHAAEMQIQDSNEVSRMQNMNQQQAGSQLGHVNESSGGSVDMQNVSSSSGARDVFGGRH